MKIQEEQIYQQESDERKAQKRVREAAQKENREAAGQIHESYVIQPGDTLYQICMNRYGNIEALSQLCQLNGMSADETIYPGQVIVLPQKIVYNRGQKVIRILLFASVPTS